jgi:hypothetical protein
MRALWVSLSAAVAAALLASCSGGNLGSPASVNPRSDASASKVQALHRAGAVSIIPRSALPQGPVELKGRQAPPQEMKGIYAAQFFASSVNGYTKNNSGNATPICTVTGLSNVNNLATDTIGNLIVPNAFDGVLVYTGPQMCGPLMATITDSYGQASDAAAVNAASGTIAVSNILGPGYAVTCTVSSMSCSELTPPSSGYGEMAGVGVDKAGDCWFDGYNAAFTAVALVYYAGCTGTPQVATGFQNTGYGGLDVDNGGNVVSFDWHGSAGADLWVYSGCNPACKSVSDNALTENTAIFGHIGKQGQRLVVGAYLAGQVDIYKYTPTALTYYYSFNNSLTASDDVEGVAYSPSSKK